MKLPIFELPRQVPVQRERVPQDNIPQTRPERERFLRLAKEYAAATAIVTPIGFDELRSHTDGIIAAEGLDEAHRDYLAVLLNNALWHDQLAAVPYERRLLLLSKCLRIEDKCPAPFDELGLLCKQCGLCTIQELQEEAERLGYAVLVAEGSAIVMALIETGRIEAIVGVSCVSVLEKSFPYMEAAAIPGLAIPLLQDDCRDTTVDIEWVWDVIHLSSEDRTNRLDLDALRSQVQGYFEQKTLQEVLGVEEPGLTERLAIDWLAQAGKRWRPFLLASVIQAFALQSEPDAVPPSAEAIRGAAVAVECFHKASLIHDDIEDEDELRYGESTLHARHGVAIALNVGDFLVGEGYRLLAELELPPEQRGRLLQIAARGHRTLCLGQGAELGWARELTPLSAVEVLRIHERKTAPAFQVALAIGAVIAGADEPVFDVIEEYSRALGIAYQIRDDLEDLSPGEAPDDLSKLRPSLPLAIAAERAKGDQARLLAELWRRNPEAHGRLNELPEIIRSLGAEERCRGLLESYKEEAIRALMPLQHASLKGLLRRVVGKIFTLEIRGWCKEHEAPGDA